MKLPLHQTSYFFCCIQTHLPGFVQQAGDLKSKGIEEIACISVNDAFVMAAWGKEHGADGKVWFALWYALWFSTFISSLFMIFLILSYEGSNAGWSNRSICKGKNSCLFSFHLKFHNCLYSHTFFLLFRQLTCCLTVIKLCRSWVTNGLRGNLVLPFLKFLVKISMLTSIFVEQTFTHFWCVSDMRCWWKMELWRRSMWSLMALDWPAVSPPTFCLSCELMLSLLF